MKPVAFCSLLLGLLQLAAITMGLQAWLNVHWSVTILMALLVVGLPVIGPVAAVLGAAKAWQWPLAKAAIVFLVPLLVIMALSGDFKSRSKTSGPRASGVSVFRRGRIGTKRPATIDL